MKDFEPYDTIGHNFLCHLRKSKTGPISSKKSRTFVPVVPREVFAVANRIVVQGRLVNNALHAVGEGADFLKGKLVPDMVTTSDSVR